MWKILTLAVVLAQTVVGFIDLFETEHAQQQLAEEIIDIAGITKAKELIDKMKDGVGGTTVAIHHPSGRQFIHRNRWIMTCNGLISKENGHCNGDALESVTAFRPESIADYCFIKTYHSINETLCLSSHPVNVSFANGTVICESVTEFFPALAISIEDYLKSCEKISANVTYIYYANDNDPDHVDVPNENPHVHCDNLMKDTNMTSPVTEKTMAKKKKRLTIGKEYEFALNRTGVCAFTEQDKLVLKLLQYLKL